VRAAETGCLTIASSSDDGSTTTIDASTNRRAGVREPW
jgi:hypothetical protein